MENLLTKIFAPGVTEELKHLKAEFSKATTEGDKTKSKRIMNKIIHVQLFRFHNTIELWKTGIDNFENVEYPTNEELIRVYNDAVLDAHLTALIESRKKKTTGSEFKIVNDEMEEIPEETEKLKGQWFLDAMGHALDSIFYGYSLLQFGDQYGDDFKSVKIVPREFVYPQKQIVRNSPTSDSGIPWSKYSKWIVPAGRDCDMGLLAKASPLTIYKKAALGSWADFTDLFGTPFRLGKTDVRDETTRDNMANMFENMVSSSWAVVDKEDEVEFVQGKNVDAYETFNTQIERLNSEMSKLILGSTMTTDDGSSRSQSEVHETTTNQIVKADAVFAENWINKCLIPWLNTYHGFNIKGRFMFDTTEVLSIEQEFARDLELLKVDKYTIPAEYIAEKYGVPVEEKEDDDPDDDPKGGGKPKDDPGGTENQLPGKFNGELIGFEQFAKEINNLYGGECCHVHNETNDSELPSENEAIPEPLTEKELENLYRDIYDGKVTPDNLPVELYTNTGEILTLGMEQGFAEYQQLGLGYVPDPSLYDALRDNAFKFAGAKTYQQTLDMSDAIVDPETGKTRTFSNFRKEVDKINSAYNKNWLQTEYNNATGSSQMASIWQDVEQDSADFPFLKYLTVSDKRVRPEHADLNGIIRPTNDPFWNSHLPPNGWNCRCTVIKLADDDEGVTDLKDRNVPELPDEFNFNVGKSRMLYSPEHPYFVVGEQGQKAIDALPKPGKKEMPKIEVKTKPTSKTLINKDSSLKDIKTFLNTSIEKNSPVKVGKTTIDSKMPREQLVKNVNQIDRLFSDYKLQNEGWKHDSPVNIRFKSGERMLGKVETMGRRKPFSTKFEYLAHKTFNFGSKNATPEAYAKKGLQRFNSKVDPENVDISTATHEFFHIIADTNAPNQTEFWGEMRKIKSEYVKELQALRESNNTEKIHDVYMGKYSHTNMDEFGAESFAEYKLTKNPSKYAQKVGKLIDKTFKK